MTYRGEIFISPRTSDSAPFKNSNKKNSEKRAHFRKTYDFLPTNTTAIVSKDLSQSIFNVSYLYFQVYYFFAVLDLDNLE